MGVRDKVVKLLAENPNGIPQSHIHKTLGVSKSWVSEILRELESCGLVVRAKVGNQYLVKAGEGLTKRSRGERTLRLGLVWSSEYPFVAPFTKLLREELGYGLEILVYPSALSATWSLVRGDVDLALSPLITQLYAYALTKAVRVIGGGAYGGSAVMRCREREPDLIASSELSTMDVCRALAIKEGFLNPLGTYYFSDPIGEVVKLASEGMIGGAVVWHPLTERLKALGFETLVECGDLGIRYCCTLAASTKLDEGLRERISITYAKALEKFARSPEDWIRWYSAKVGIEADVVKNGLKQYRVRAYVDKSEVLDMLRRVGVEVPDPSALVRAIEAH